MKVLITGGSGLLGMKLSEILEENGYDVYATFHQNPIKKDNFISLDITLKENVDHIMKKVTPDVVVHTAAYTNVDGCEKNRDKSFNINTLGTRNLADSAGKLGAKLVYISTDYVFDGEKGEYKENHATNPINYYGFTKLEGEKSVEKILNDFIIARTSVIYGVKKRNFVTWIIDSLEKGDPVNIVTDQYVSPTLNVDLAEQLIALIEKNTTGLFHTAGRERISRYDFAKIVADIFSLDKSRINPVSIKDMNWISLRPRDSSLDVFKVTKFKKPFKIRESIGLLKTEMENSL